MQHMDDELKQMTHCADIKLVLEVLCSNCNVMKTVLKDSKIITDSQKELLVENSSRMKKDLNHLESLLELLHCD